MCNTINNPDQGGDDQHYNKKIGFISSNNTFIMVLQSRINGPLFHSVDLHKRMDKMTGGRTTQKHNVPPVILGGTYTYNITVSDTYVDLYIIQYLS